jgi:hypothetical protein
MEKFGEIVFFYGLPLQAYFYVLYIIGSVFIFFGARKFVHRPVEIL